MQQRFPKNRTHFLYYNIARNEESFGRLWSAFYIQKTNKLSVKFLFPDHSLMIAAMSYTQSKPKHVKHSTQHALILQCEIPSSEFKIKMQRTKFYETLYKKARNFTSSRDLIQQTNLIQQNPTNSTPKSSNQIKH